MGLDFGYLESRSVLLLQEYDILERDLLVQLSIFSKENTITFDMQRISKIKTL